MNYGIRPTNRTAGRTGHMTEALFRAFQGLFAGFRFGRHYYGSLGSAGTSSVRFTASARESAKNCVGFLILRHAATFWEGHDSGPPKQACDVSFLFSGQEE